MSIGIVGAGNMGSSIAAQLAKTGEEVSLSDRNPGKAGRFHSIIRDMSVR